MEPAPRTRLIAGLVSLLVLGAVAVASLIAISPPSPLPADAPAGQFAAGRAFRHVETIGAQQHVTGSPAAARVRDYLVTTLRDLGYAPEVRAGIGQTDALGGPAMASVSNVVATIPGSDSTGRLILVAHYDSVQVSYGANDDGSGVAVLLETARALASGPPLRNDLVLLFTDAEEACLCGAESFVHADPLAAAGGVVLNFESRGASGPPVMFETAHGNARLIAEYAAAVPYPVATSMAVEVYRILPNDTDFTPFLASGRFTGLNSAYIDGSAVYHSPEDRPEYLDRGTLQAHGANALALARQLGDADLAPLSQPASFDATYFPVFGTLVYYPGWLVWPLAVAAVLAVAALGVAVHRRYRAGWGRLAAGFGLMPVPLVGSAVVAQLFWMLLVAMKPAYGQMIDPWRPGWYRLALCALVAAVVLGWYALWRRRCGPRVLAAASLGWLALLGLAMAAVTPGGSYLPVLPALAGAVTGILACYAHRWWLRWALGLLAGIVGVVVLVPTMALFFPALGLATGAAAAVLAAMLGLVLLPVFELLHRAFPSRRRRDDEAADGASDSEGGRVLHPRDGEAPAMAAPDPSRTAWHPRDGEAPDVLDPAGARQPPAAARRPRRGHAAVPAMVALVAAVVLTAAGLGIDRFDAAHPRPTQLMYALDTDTGQAYWASQQQTAHGWLSGYVGERADLSGEFPMLSAPVLTGPAPVAELPAPRLAVDSARRSGGHRILTVTVHPQRDVRLVSLTAPDAHVVSATVRAGGVEREMHLAGDGFALLFHGPLAGGVTVTMVLDGTGPVTFRVMDGSDGLGGLPGFTPRPDDVGIQGSHTSELVLVAHSVTV